MLVCMCVCVCVCVSVCERVYVCMLRRMLYLPVRIIYLPAYLLRFINKKGEISEENQVRYKYCKDLDELQHDLDLSILDLEIIALL